MINAVVSSGEYSLTLSQQDTHSWTDQNDEQPHCLTEHSKELGQHHRQRKGHSTGLCITEARDHLQGRLNHIPLLKMN